MTRSSGELELAAFLEDTRAWIEAELERRLPPEDAHPALLHRALRYAVFATEDGDYVPPQP